MRRTAVLTALVVSGLASAQTYPVINFETVDAGGSEADTLIQPLSQVCGILTITGYDGGIDGGSFWFEVLPVDPLNPSVPIGLGADAGPFSTAVSGVSACYNTLDGGSPGVLAKWTVTGANPYFTGVTLSVANTQAVLPGPAGPQGAPGSGGTNDAGCLVLSNGSQFCASPDAGYPSVNLIMNGDGGALQISNLGYGLFAEFGQDADPNFAGVFVGDVANPLRTRTNYSIISSPDDLANDTWVNVETGGSDGFRIHDNGRFVCNNFGCFMSSAAGSAIGYTDLVGLDINGLMAFSEAGKDAGYIGVLSNSDTMTAGSWAFGGGPTGTFCFWDPTLVNIESATNFSLCMFGDAGVTALNAASEIRAKIAGTTVIDVKPGNTTINGNLDIDGGCLTLGGVIYCSLQDAGFGGGGGFPSDGGACLTMASGEVRCPLSPGGVVETPVDGGVFELNGIERFTGNGPTEQADPLGAGGELFTAVDAGPAPPSGQQQMYYCFNIPGASGPLCIGDQGGSGNSPAIWFGLNAMGIDAGNLTPAPTFMNPGLYGNALANFLYVNVLHGGTFAVRQDDVGILTCTQNDGSAATNYSTCTLGSAYSQAQDGGAIGGRLFLDGLGGSWIVGSQTGQVRLGADAGYTFNLGGGPFEVPEGTPILNLVPGLATVNGTLVAQNLIADGGKVSLDTSGTTYAQKSNGYYGITQNGDTLTIGSTAFGGGPTGDVCFYDPTIASQSATNYSLCFLGGAGVSMFNGVNEIRNQIGGSTVLDVNGSAEIAYQPMYVGFASTDYWALSGGAGTITAAANGSDSTVNLIFDSKGAAGAVYFETGGTLKLNVGQFSTQSLQPIYVYDPASTSAVTISGSATNQPTIATTAGPLNLSPATGVTQAAEVCSAAGIGCVTPAANSSSNSTIDAPTGQCVDATVNAGGTISAQFCGSVIELNEAVQANSSMAVDTSTDTGTWLGFGTHALDLGSAPTLTASSENACLGTLSSKSIAGGDGAGIISFTTGTTSACAADTALFTVTLHDAYSSAGYVIMVSDADGTAGILSTSAYYAIPTSASVFTIHNVSAITPAESTAYKLQFMTMGAGATH